MRKKLLLGSLLVLTLLLLMPTIPAIQQKKIEEGVKQEFREKLDSVNFKEIIDEYLSGDKKHPYLYQLVIILLFTVLFRYLFWIFLTLSCCEADGMAWIPKYENLFVIFMYMAGGVMLRLLLWAGFFNYVSNKMGWNWIIPFILE